MIESYKTLVPFSISDMVCYSSMSPLPFLASMLYSASIPYSFSCCTHNLFSTFVLPLYSVLYMHAIRCTFDIHFFSCTWSHSTHMHNYQKRALLFYVLHMFITPSHLWDNPSNSSSSLAVILSLFIISRLSRDSLPSLAVWPFFFYVTIELILFVIVTFFDTLQSVNCLYDESSFHWQLSSRIFSSSDDHPKALQIL